MPRLVDHEERRSHLLATLWRIVERDGAGEISIRHVATEADVSKSSIAHYFPDRLSLLVAAVDQLYASGDAALASLDLDDGRLGTAVESVCAAIPHTPERLTRSEVWLLLISERRTDPAVRQLAVELDARVRVEIRAALARWARTGLVHPERDLDLETLRLHGLIDGLSLHLLHDPTQMSAARLREVVAVHLGELAHAPSTHSVESA
jgi:AcrR family transcriptional regulator